MMQKKTLWEKDDLKLGELIFRSKGKTKKKEFVELKRAVVLIVPVEQNTVYLLREYRPFFNRTVWRLPAGHIEPNETPLHAAKRELAEEAGIKARKLKLIAKYQYMGWIKYTFYIFWASKLTQTEKNLEFYEKIKVKKVSKPKAITIAFDQMVEPHHAFAVLKTLHSI